MSCKKTHLVSPIEASEGSTSHRWWRGFVGFLALVPLGLLALPARPAHASAGAQLTRGAVLTTGVGTLNGRHRARVVVIGSRGRYGRRARAQIERALTSSGVEVLATEAYSSRARERGLGMFEMTNPDAVAEIAKDAKVDGVIVCHVIKRWRRRTVSIELMDPQGNLQFEKMQRVGRRGLSRTLARLAVTDLVQALPQAPTSAPTQEPSAPEPPPAEPPPAEPPPPQPIRPPVVIAAAPVADVSASHSQDRERVARPLIGVRAIGGGGMRHLRTKNSLHAQNDNQGLTYKTKSPYAETGVMFETHPLRDFGAFAEGFAVEVLLIRSVGATAVDKSAPEPFDTEQRRISADIGYELRLGDGRLDATITAWGGWSRSEFMTSRKTDLLTPTRHTGVRGGAELRVPLHKGYVDLQLRGTYMPKAVAGRAQTNAHGQQVVGFGYGGRVALLGTSGGHATGLTWGIWAEMQTYKEKFVNTAIDVETGSVEQLLTGAATLGLAF